MHPYGSFSLFMASCSSCSRTTRLLRKFSYFVPHFTHFYPIPQIETSFHSRKEHEKTITPWSTLSRSRLFIVDCPNNNACHWRGLNQWIRQLFWTYCFVLRQVCREQSKHNNDKFQTHITPTTKVFFFTTIKLKRCFGFRCNFQNIII